MDAKVSFSFHVIYFGGERQHMSYMYRQEKTKPKNSDFKRDFKGL